MLRYSWTNDEMIHDDAGDYIHQRDAAEAMAELLVACKELLQRETEVIGMDGSPFAVDVALVRQARAAIARAEGTETKPSCCVCTKPAVDPVTVNGHVWCRHCYGTIDRQLEKAAPKLLAALKRIVNDAEPGEAAQLTVDGYNQACAAIAEAEGAAP